jgi:hypothetical protein
MRGYDSVTGDLTPILIAADVLMFLTILWRRRRRRARTGRDGPLPLAVVERRTGVSDSRHGQRLMAGREMCQRLRGRTLWVATVLILLGVAATIFIPVATHGKPH